MTKSEVMKLLEQYSADSLLRGIQNLHYREVLKDIKRLIELTLYDDETKNPPGQQGEL